MYCERCGTQIEEGHKYCGSCGKPVGIAVVPASAEGRVGRHAQILGILWLAASALNLIGGACVLFVGFAVFGRLVQVRDVPVVPGLLQGIFGAIGVVLLLKAILGFAAGWGLIEREPWARMLALVLGFISLLNIPLGTALGIYTIWVLLPMQSEAEYRMSGRRAA